MSNFFINNKYKVFECMMQRQIGYLTQLSFRSKYALTDVANVKFRRMQSEEATK